jgi:predicted lipid carrier protein YhbT
MGEPFQDAQSAVARIKRALAGAPVQIAESLAKTVQSASPERLEQLMQTPARRVVLDAIFWQMPQFLDRQQSRKLNASVRWTISGRAAGGADVYDLVFTDGRCRVIRGGGTVEPPVAITVDGVEFLRIAAGSSDPMRAYFNSRIAITGDIMVAARLVSLFRIPRGRR